MSHATNTTRNIIAELLATYDQKLREAFLSAVDDIRNTITLRVIVERLEKGDVAGAIKAMNLDADAFARLELAIREAYNAGGAATVAAMPKVRDPDGNRAVFRFGVRNLAAETWLTQHSSTLVTRIIDDQREAIRTALTEGLSAGTNPRQTALDVIGRVSRASNRRTGGIIGLTGQQAQFVASARRELSSGDPDAMARYLARGRRDKRFDRTVLTAIKSGRPIPSDMVAKITGRYADRLLELRGEMIARTETMTALGTARDDAIRQQINAGKIAVEDVTKIWHSAGDDRVRHTHTKLDGDRVPMDGQFRSPSGAMLRYPGDPQGGPGEIINCRCWCEYKIDHFASVVRRNRAA